MKALIAMVTCITTLLIVIACSKKVPGCSDQETQDLVINISKDLFPIYKEFSFKLQSIRTANVDKETGACSCAAELYLVSSLGANITFPITYKTELTDKGELYVTVRRGK